VRVACALGVERAAEVRVGETAQELARSQLQPFLGHGPIAVDIDAVVEQFAAAGKLHDLGARVTRQWRRAISCAARVKLTT
jgi:hypothetical protein